MQTSLLPAPVSVPPKARGVGSGVGSEAGGGRGMQIIRVGGNVR